MVGNYDTDLHTVWHPGSWMKFKVTEVKLKTPYFGSKYGHYNKNDLICK